jgi:uncharacterized membrane protein YqjE
MQITMEQLTKQMTEDERQNLDKLDRSRRRLTSEAQLATTKQQLFVVEMEEKYAATFCQEVGPKKVLPLRK